jgi:hypothetical protein
MGHNLFHALLVLQRSAKKPSTTMYTAEAFSVPPTFLHSPSHLFPYHSQLTRPIQIISPSQHEAYTELPLYLSHVIRYEVGIPHPFRDLLASYEPFFLHHITRKVYSNN